MDRETVRVVLRSLSGRWVPLALLVSLLSMEGCLSAIAMHEAVLAYDRTANRVGSEELLLNIARAKNHHPIHFTSISSVAATFNFEVNAAATPPLGGLEGGVKLSPIFGGSMSENPTITIVPVEGEEFNQRVLTPMTENKFYMLYQQGADLGMLLRMMAAELRFDKAGGGERVLRNRPRRPSEYDEFRRRVLHLVALHEAHQLFVDQIVIEQTVTLTVSGGEGAGAGVVLEALEKGFRWTQNGDSGVLSRKMPGRIVIANYDLDLLTKDERQKLYLEANALSNNEVLVDIRSGHPGGDYPMQGVFRLRGFLAIIGFLARGLVEEPEYAVDKDPRTASVPFNPARTLEIYEGTSKPANAAFAIDYQDRVYAVVNAEDQAGVWNLEAFRLLNQLYELSVHPSEFARPAPGITIAK